MMKQKYETIRDYTIVLPPRPQPYPEGFKSDGCSGKMSQVWNYLFKKAPPWETCCVEHDVAYWRGGFWLDRKQADLALAQCVRNNGHPIWAFIMYWAVRIGNVPWLPLPYRWGNGWPYVGRYERRDESEKLTKKDQ